MDAKKPKGEVLASYEAAEDKYHNAHPDVLVFGDSRASMWPDAQVEGALGGSSLCNMGDIGSVVEDAIWRAENTHIDLSHVTKCVVEIGINNINRWGDTESPNFIAGGVDKLVAVLAAKCAPGCEFFVVEPFEEIPRGVGTDKMRSKLTHALDAHADAHGYTYVGTHAMDPHDADYFRPGGLHLTDLGYSTYLTPALKKAEMHHSGPSPEFSFGDQGHMAITGHETSFVETMLDQAQHHFVLETVDLGDPFVI